jgi:hypothetical protein
MHNIPGSLRLRKKATTADDGISYDRIEGMPHNDSSSSEEGEVSSR